MILFYECAKCGEELYHCAACSELKHLKDMYLVSTKVSYCMRCAKQDADSARDQIVLSANRKIVTVGGVGHA